MFVQVIHIFIFFTLIAIISHMASALCLTSSSTTTTSASSTEVGASSGSTGKENDNIDEDVQLRRYDKSLTNFATIQAAYLQWCRMPSQIEKMYVGSHYWFPTLRRSHSADTTTLLLAINPAYRSAKPLDWFWIDTPMDGDLMMIFFELQHQLVDQQKEYKWIQNFQNCIFTRAALTDTEFRAKYQLLSHREMVRSNYKNEFNDANYKQIVLDLVRVDEEQRNQSSTCPEIQTIDYTQQLMQCFSLDPLLPVQDLVNTSKDAKVPKEKDVLVISPSSLNNVTTNKWFMHAEDKTFTPAELCVLRLRRLGTSMLRYVEYQSRPDLLRNLRTMCATMSISCLHQLHNALCLNRMVEDSQLSVYFDNVVRSRLICQDRIAEFVSMERAYRRFIRTLL